MATHLLLLGAGFSHNWGGWLASEFFNVLLGDAAVQQDSELNVLLWRHQPASGFEAALAELQLATLTNPNLAPRRDALESGLRRVFAQMNAAYFRREGGFEFRNETDWSIQEFLARFAAIFSLNQDLLLERHYINDNVSLKTAQRLLGAILPGVRWPHPRPIDYMPHEWDQARWTVEGPLDVPQRMQPIYKLHGSSSWVRPDGRDLLVLGGAKADAIAGAELLDAYFAEFRRRLSMPDMRLTIIGYGFGDAHINDALRQAEAAGLKLFIIDPAGAGVFNKLDDPTPFQRMTTGISSRSLTDTFSGDLAERDRILGFFTV